MVLDAVSNFVRGNTDAAVGTSDTTVSVADASIFPDPATDGEFNVVIWDVNNFPRPDQDGDVEILRVTERDTTDDELTVTRGQEMTSAAAHPEGSAIHLSPTAKMFTDIEDTFTTETEAADAAPVQSVFDRVGDVVAETGDYAATQISNFSSEVLTSISGSTIAPSEITDLWNGTVVTADVNNTNTTTTALEAEKFTLDGSPEESLVLEQTFTDEIIDLDIDTSNLKGRYELEVFGRAIDTNINLNLRFDNSTGENYRQISINDAGIQSVEDNDELLLISTSAFHPFMGQFHISVGNDSRHWGAFGNAFTRDLSDTTLLRGNHRGEDTDANSIQIFSDAEVGNTRIVIKAFEDEFGGTR